MGKEYEQSIPIVDSAFSAGVSHFVFSTLSNTEEESNGKYHVVPFTTKAKIESYIRGKGFKYTTFPAAAFYYQNFKSFFPPKPDADGNLSITLPSTKLIAGIDITQFGGIVSAIFNNPEKYNGLFVAVAGDNQSPQQYVDAISEKIGKPIKLNLVSQEVFASFGFPGAEELAEMFAWFNDYGFFGKQSWEQGKKIDPTLRNFKDYLISSNYQL